MKTSWEKLVQYVGTNHGQDISNELQNLATVTIAEPTYSDAILARHAAREAMIRTGQRNMQMARLTSEAALQAAVDAGIDPRAPMELAQLQNEIAQGEFEANSEVPIELSESEKTLNISEWRTYRERSANLLKHRGQAYSLILGQCTQLLQDKMKQDADWTTVSTSYDPLTLFRLIEKTVLAQTEDQYPFATVYDQEHAFYSFRQETLTNPQWYEKFNTRIDVAEAIGVTRNHKALLEYVAKDVHKKKFADLGAAIQEAVRVDAEERYRAYVFLRQSGAQHANLRTVLQNDFTTGDDHYPKNRQSALHLLDKFSKTTVSKATTQSEGTAFAQGGGRGRGAGRGQQKTFDKEYWKDKECYKCHKKGHPATHCTKKDDDEASVASTKSTVSKLQKDIKSIKKKFTTVNAQLQQLQEGTSDVSDSEDEEVSHFQFQFTQVEPKFEPCVANLFKQAHADTKFDIDLREVILLDSQSTSDLFCNRAFVEETMKSSSSLRLKSNGGTMMVRQKAKVNGYHANVWFSEKAITNIFALGNVVKQYRVTYDSDELMFVVHRESAGKPDMHFRMHTSGLHYYDPREDGAEAEALAFVETVSDNLKGFTKRQIKGAEAARALYITLCYPSMKDFKWVIRSNQIKDCPVTVQDVEVASKIWGKSIAALKGKTTRSKPAPVAKDYVKVPTELLRLHKEVFLTIDIIFVNKIPFFLTLSRKICFTTVNHLANRTVAEIFKAFKEIYQYYLQRGFRITTVHADGEFEPVAALITSMPGGPAVNLASANEHVPEIERRARVVKERCRASRHDLPFKRIPKLLTIWLVFNVVKLLNFFPPKGGISDTLSPKTIMSGETLDFKKHLCLKVGQYCQVHEEENPRNSQIARTRGAISLGPSGNLQGGFRFMALNTGKKITRRSWDALPMPDLVIARVNELGSDQPEMLTFTDRHGRPIGDHELPDVASDEDDDTQLPGVDAPLPGVDPVIDDNIEITGVDDVVAPETTPTTVEIDDDLDFPDNDPAPIEAAPAPALDPPAPAPDPNVPAQVQAPTAPGLRRSTRVRTKKKEYTPSMTGTKYSYAVTQLESHGVLNPDAHMFVQDDFYQAEPDVVASIMTQLSLKAGLKEWGDEALEAATSANKASKVHAIADGIAQQARPALF